MKITDAIRGEHAAMRPNLRQIREATDPGCQMKPYAVKIHARALWTTIRAHAAVEEPMLKLLREHKVAKHALAEHKQLETLIKLAYKTGDQKALNKAVRLALGHFNEEEEDVFPLAEKVFCQKKLAQLGLEWAQSRGLL